jgi:hypothetical protein
MQAKVVKAIKHFLECLQAYDSHQMHNMIAVMWHVPNSLIDSNVSLKWKQWKSKESESLAHNTLGVEGRVGAPGWD